MTRRRALAAVVLLLGATARPKLTEVGEAVSDRPPGVPLLLDRGECLASRGVAAGRAAGVGYVEGQNVVIERRYSEGRDERLPELAAELVRLKVDVIVATGGSPPYAAQRATSTIPIVFTDNGDPVGSGLVASLARPGGNITGPSLTSPALLGKRLQLLKEAVPGVSRVAILSNPASPMHGLSMKEAEAAARSLHVQLQVVEARTPPSSPAHSRPR